MTPSLRTRLLTRTVAGTVLLLTIFSLTVYVVIRRALLDQFDSALASVAHILAASVEIDGDEIELEFEVSQMPEFQNAEQPTYYQLWRADGTVTAKSPLLQANDLARLEGAVGAPVFGKPQRLNARPLRTVGLVFRPRTADSEEEHDQPIAADSEEERRHSLPAEQTLTLAVARDMTAVMGQLRFLRWLLLIASAAVAALSLLIASVAVRQGLAPLNSIACEIAAISQGNLTSRIGGELVPAEILPIKDRLNDLLARLEGAFKRERRFTADVAHELRNPLAGLRSTIEVTLTRGRDDAEYKTVLSDCLEISENMQTMVNNLLTLARLDAHQVTFHREQIRLAELAEACWEPFREKATKRRIVFENRVPDEITCQSDPEQLSMALRNLLDNAAEYTNESGQILLDARRIDDSVEITVSNTGCPLTTEQVSHVFDRFWRADAARTDAGRHCGLGLALVKRIAAALSGAIAAKIDRSETFTITLTLPCPQPPTTD